MQPCVVEQVKSFIDAVKVTTIDRIRSMVHSRLGVNLGKHADRRILRDDLRYSRKRTAKRLNNRCVVPVVERVAQFSHSILPRLAAQETVVSVDECYFSEKVLPLYGYSPVTEKCIVTTPTGSWKL